MTLTPAPMAANDLLKQIYDINGLHPVSVWPLAYGWWLVFIFGLMAFLLAFVFLWRRHVWRQSWKSDAARTLSDLEGRLNVNNAHSIVAVLSVTLRRIAMRRYSRSDCAGLEGPQWLAWLEAHDPRGFTWSCAGRLLIDAPYAPPKRQLEPEMVLTLIRAAKKWVV